MTPDSLSREGSPVPEPSMEQEVASAAVHIVQQAPPQPQQLSAHPTMPAITDLRFSQSAPGSPSGLVPETQLVQKGYHSLTHSMIS